MRPAMSRKKYLVFYSAVFCLFCLGAFFLFLKKGRSMVWNQDGGPQYLPYLAYTGRYLRDWFARMLSGDFSFQMFDFRIGFGSDVGAVVRAHPLDFLSVFVPVRYTEILYHVILLARLYLAGLAFTFCCTLFRELSWHMLTGSMIYIFSGFVYVYAVRHPIYGSAMIMLPLVLAGAERMLRGGSFRLLSASVCLGFFCNYYFMYQVTIACAIYVLLRFPYVYTKKRAGSFIRLFFRMAPAYLLGAGMSMLVLLPVIRSLGSSARLAEHSAPGNLLFYETEQMFQSWYLYLTAPRRGLPGGTSLNYCVLILPALAALFTDRRRESLALKLAFLLGTVFVFVPFFGYMMAGFSAVNNRWIYIYSFLVSLIFVLYADRLRTWLREKKAKLILALLFALYLAFALAGYARRGSIEPLAGCALFGLAVLLLYASAGWAEMAGRLSARLSAWFPQVLLVFAFVCCSVNAFFVYSGRFGNALSEYLEAGSALKLIERSEFTKLKQAQTDSFGRMDSNLVNSNRENYSLLLDYYPTCMYNSVLSGPMTYALLEQGNIGLASIHRIQGLDGRTAAEALSNVTGFLTAADGDAHAPYGFARSEELSDADNAVFLNQYPLRFGYTYTRFLPRSEFDRLNALQKEQAMLTCAVLEDAQAGEIPEGTTAAAEAGEAPEGMTAATAEEIAAGMGIEETPLSLPESGAQIKRTKEGYRVLESGGYLTFPIRKRAGCETYLRLEGFSGTKVSTTVYVRTKGTDTVLSMRGPGTIYSLNRVDYEVRLGYFKEDEEDTLRLEFSDKGRYKLTGASVCYVPMAGYEEKIGALNSQGMTRTKMGVNCAEGTARMNSAGLVTFSIPYSEGWSAQADGRNIKVYRVNTAYLGVYLEPGDHTLKLSYTTPGAVAGRWISLLCLLLFGGAGHGRAAWLRLSGRLRRAGK